MLAAFIQYIWVLYLAKYTMQCVHRLIVHLHHCLQEAQPSHEAAWHKADNPAHSLVSEENERLGAGGQPAHNLRQQNGMPGPIGNHATYASQIRALGKDLFHSSWHILRYEHFRRTREHCVAIKNLRFPLNPHLVESAILKKQGNIKLSGLHEISHQLSP